MSFQPQAPMFGQQPPPLAPAPVAAPAKGKRRKGMIIAGLIVLLVGLIGGGAIVAKAMSNYEEAVKSLARAPVGCTTTLVFDKPATFTFYIETKGQLGDLGGDCEANAGPYEHTGDKLPKVSLTLEDPNGDPVDLQRGATASYDAAGFVGTAIRTADIAQAGTFHLNVESDESDFAIAIGKDPKKDSETLTAIGGGVALVGVVVGLLLFLLGLRRRRPDPVTSDVRNPVGPLPGWPPSPYAPAPVGPPGLPLTPAFAPQPGPLLLPGQPPTRPPEQPVGGGFAPPTLAPPPPPSSGGAPVIPAGPPTSAPPTLPPAGAPPVGAPPTAAPPDGPPPVVAPPPAPSSGGWSIPVEDEDSGAP